MQFGKKLRESLQEVFDKLRRACYIAQEIILLLINILYMKKFNMKRILPIRMLCKITLKYKNNKKRLVLLLCFLKIALLPTN